MCDFPYSVENKFFKMNKNELSKVPVPCGKCYECLKAKINQWVFRIQQEAKHHELQHWVTLTYNTDHVPISKRGYLTLDKSDVQKYFKRLRKAVNSQIKYFIVGEYGSKYNRPHYHAIIFGATQQQIIDSWMLEGKPLGHVHFGKVETGSLAYTLKYMFKDSTVIPEHLDDRVPEFRLMSKGLGRGYITENMKNYHKKDVSRSYVLTPDGYKVPMPRIYREEIYDLRERTQQRSQAIKKGMQSDQAKYDEYMKTWQEGDKSFEAWQDEQRIMRLRKINQRGQTSQF